MSLTGNGCRYPQEALVALRPQVDSGTSGSYRNLVHRVHISGTDGKRRLPRQLRDRGRLAGVVATPRRVVLGPHYCNMAARYASCPLRGLLVSRTQIESRTADSSNSCRVWHLTAVLPAAQSNSHRGHYSSWRFESRRLAPGLIFPYRLNVRWLSVAVET